MRTSLVGWVGLPIVLVACNALLGDFTVGDAGGGDSGGSDAPDDSPTFFALKCTEGASSRTPLTTGNALNSNFLRMGTLPGGNVRVVLPNAPPALDGGQAPPFEVRAYTFDPHNPGSSLTTTTLPTTNSYQPLALSRYTGLASGFALVFQAPDTNNMPAIWLSTIPDAAPNWSPPQILCPAPTGGNSNIQATIAPVDPANGVFFLAYSITAGPSQDIYMGVVQPNGNPLPNQPVHFATTTNDRSIWSLLAPGIAQKGNQAYVILLPSGDNGPPPLGSPVKILVPGGTDITLTPPSNLNYFPAAFDNSVDPLKADVAFLVADLNSLTGSYRVGRVAYDSLNGFDPQSLLLTGPPVPDGGSVSLSELFVSQSAQHWEQAGGQGEQYLMMSPTADPVSQTLYGGVNFAWWDGSTGALRAYQAGNGSQLLSDVPFVAANDVTFQTLVGSIANLSVAFISDVSAPKNGGGGALTAGDLYFTQIGCQKAP